MATNLRCYFTLRMRNYPWHISIRLANIYSILSSINIYPLLNTVLKNVDRQTRKTTCAPNVVSYNIETWKVMTAVSFMDALAGNESSKFDNYYHCWNRTSLLFHASKKEMNSLNDDNDIWQVEV